ncbi:polysaccharide deacetylase family protein [Pedobacter montanisoli]|uniref:Polysaccharide deacetylase family protein n=1 Tax=Pedobacter montanisoli TaxID=2923277 RepID=A0ABS9ZY64_9SPHI|nr:polysaccharide deacetylase family protein [Pedobacter montanisoli]MCJ0743240.1 polysaccharide deacetylase family protein [Pedobacter montanisoli]
MVLLSFDIEEFDMPFEYNKDIVFKDQISISIKGCEIILDLLAKYQLKATFFSTAVFALNAPGVIERIKNEGHELASHTYYHSKFENADLLKSKQVLEELSGMKVEGFRMPRMMPVSDEEIEEAGYIYNSSLNPTYLPGRYNNLHIPRTYFKQGKVWQLPATVSPKFRIPLFWLSFHNFPLWYYKHLFHLSYQKDGYVNIYFHPWEFTDLQQKEKYGFPFYVSRNSGVKMEERMDALMNWISKKGYPTGTISNFIKSLT